MEELKRHPRFWVLTFLFGVLLFLFLSRVEDTQGKLTVAFLDVGQGDAVFIETPNGNQLLYDSGPPSGALLRSLRKVMPLWDRSLDVIMLSHPDLDHTGGFPEILKRFKVDLALEPGKFSGNGAYETIQEKLNQSDVASFEVRAGMKLELGGGVYAQVLYPDTDVTTLDTNDASIVLRLVYKDTSVMLSGDLSSRYEEKLAKKHGSGLKANILKLGHHGSHTSTSVLWLSAVRPEYAVISAGKDNRYGHPHKEVTQRLTLYNIPYFETAKQGNIVFESDGSTFVRVD